MNLPLPALQDPCWCSVLKKTHDYFTLRASWVGWRPSLIGWRPSLLGWRPSLLGWRPSLVGWRPSQVGGHRYQVRHSFSFVYFVFCSDSDCG